jgi:hypothetical protein
MPVPMTGYFIGAQLPVAGSKRSTVPLGIAEGTVAQLQCSSTSTTPIFG